MTFSDADITALWLTLQLAGTTTLVLLIIGTPLAVWLARSNSWLSVAIGAVVAVPLVLPPTVLGFYLLLAFSPTGPVGQLTEALGLNTLPFTFTGLVIASVIYSLPFVVQPIQNAMQAVGQRPSEVAATLGAPWWDRFFLVQIPMARHGFFTAGILGFAHTVGEFGVVLMIGGNIPGETRVVSVQMYDHVESLAYADAHQLAAVLLVFSFVTLFVLYAVLRRNPDQALTLR